MPSLEPQDLPAVRHLVVDESSEGQRLDNFLLKMLKGVPKSHVYRVIRSGEVRVNKGRAQAETRLAVGDRVRLPPLRMQATGSGGPPSPPTRTPPREFPVVFEDDALLVIDKPAGVAVHGGSGVSFGVIEQLRRARPEARFLELVHRLDKETSGLLVLAKKRSALVALQEALRDHRGPLAIRKTYSAIVWGDWPASVRVIDAALHKGHDEAGERHVRVVSADHEDARRAITLVSVAERLAGFTRLDVTIKTGRTHQIRVHLANQGHAIVGDPKYGDFARNKALARGDRLPGLRLARMALHARALTLQHPLSATPLHLEAALPPEWAALSAQAALQPAAQPAQPATP
jgi:23S rRNA pseudouridine955/2504/2580 synthase